MSAVSREARPQIAIDLDRWGKIPLLGTLVGVARIVVNFVIGFFSMFAAIYYMCKDLNDQSHYWSCLLAHSAAELKRGFLELFCLTYFTDRFYEGPTSANSIIETLFGAHGNIYPQTLRIVPQN